MQPILDDCFFFGGEKVPMQNFNPTRQEVNMPTFSGGDLPCLNSCRPDKCVSKPHGRVEFSRKQKETIGSFHLFEIICRYDI